MHSLGKTFADRKIGILFLPDAIEHNTHTPPTRIHTNIYTTYMMLNFLVDASEKRQSKNVCCSKSEQQNGGYYAVGTRQFTQQRKQNIKIEKQFFY